MATAPAPEKLFVRQATGLVREIGLLTAVLIAVTNTVGFGWQGRVFQFTGPAIVPETQYVLGWPPMAMAFLIIGIIVLISIGAFAIVTTAMPRSGGGYVAISRIVHPYVGYVATWMVYFGVAIAFGQIAAVTIEFIAGFGFIAGISAPADPYSLVGIGLIIMLFFAGMATLGVRMFGLLLQVMFWIPAAITVGVYYLLLTATPAAMNAGFTQVTGTTPDQMTAIALGKGMATSFTGGYWGAVGIAFSGAYWAYIGYAAANFVAGEVKEATRKLPRAMLGAGILIVLIYISASLAMYSASSLVGKSGEYSFFSSYSYLSYGPGDATAARPEGVPRARLPFIATYQAQGAGLGFFLLPLALFAALWVANDIPPFLLTASRMAFAMSFDRLLPTRVSNVSERWHSPVGAIALTTAIGLVGLFAESNIFGPGALDVRVLHYNLGINPDDMVNWTDLMDILFFAPMALACLLFPFRRKDVFERATFKPGGKWGVATIGLAALVGQLYLFGTILTAGYNLAVDQRSILVLLGLGIIVTIIYVYYKSRAKTTGVDYRTIFTQIPPE